MLGTQDSKLSQSSRKAQVLKVARRQKLVIKLSYKDLSKLIVKANARTECLQQHTKYLASQGAVETSKHSQVWWQEQAKWCINQQGQHTLEQQAQWQVFTWNTWGMFEKLFSNMTWLYTIAIISLYAWDEWMKNVNFIEHWSGKENCMNVLLWQSGHSLNRRAG